MDHGYGGVREDFAGMPVVVHVVVAPVHDLLLAPNVELRFEGLRGRVVPVGAEVAQRDVPVVLHAREQDLAAVGEAAGVRRYAVVPLANADRVVAAAPERLAQGGVRVGDRVAASLQRKRVAPGQEHRAAGHADRRVGAAHDVAVHKGEAVLGEKIHVGRVGFPVAQRADRVVTLVVREDHQHVRPPLGISWIATHKRPPLRRSSRYDNNITDIIEHCQRLRRVFPAGFYVIFSIRFT